MAPTSDASALTSGLSRGSSAEPMAPAFPPLAVQAANAIQSVVAFVGDGCGVVDDGVYRQRLEVCRTCDRRNGNRCAACGCWINVKARGRVFRCPLGRWERDPKSEAGEHAPTVPGR